MTNADAKGPGVRDAGTRRRPRVVIAGAGVAGVEALIALRDLLDGFVSIDIIAPRDDFVYRPLSVAEPFGLTEARRFPLAQIAADHGATLHRGSLENVDFDEGRVSVRGGPSLSYDALLVAAGARPVEWLGGALHFSGPEDVARMRTVVDDLDRGALTSVAFVAPAGASWTLPLYELALLSASRVAEHGRGDVRLAIVTPEPHPLEVFGPSAARHMRELCANRGITLRAATRALSIQNGQLVLEPGPALTVDRVIALPVLDGEPIDGLPSDDAGFIPVDHHGAVRGLPGVYAAGDGVAYPVKQGGIATQQADVAAEAIAASCGAAIEPRPFHPRLRGQLLTGLAPSYITAGITDAGPRDSTVALNPLWWPPSKIAGRYLAPYLANQVTIDRPGQLEDRPAATTTVAPGDTSLGRGELRDIAMKFAESDAEAGDYRSALGWLDTIEHLDGVLAPALSEQQAEWRRLAGGLSR